MNGAQLSSLLSSSELALLDLILTNEAPWLPTPGPQLDALLSLASEVYYGGAAGGGKTDLILGAAILAHSQSIIFRREFAQLSGATGLIERSRELLTGHGRYNAQEHVWRLDGKGIEFGGLQREEDKHKYRGRPHDFIGFDEVTEITESQYRFLIGWNRTTIPGQRVRVIAAGNPPSHQDGQWVIRYWAPWLEPDHPNPAKPGELRWYAVIDGEDEEVDGPATFVHNKETIHPRSRTFIPAKLSDNPYLASSGYKAVLQGLPEPLRSQLLHGDFTVGMGDDPWQVIPTDWIRAAQDRWTEEHEGPMTACGCDPARGGKDKATIATVYDNWFAPIEKYPGVAVPDGPSMATLVIQAIEPGVTIGIDVIGIGSSGYDALVANDQNVTPVNAAEGSESRDRTGKLKMRNVRAEMWWGMREALDPIQGDDIQLPPDPELLADLAAPRWKMTTSGILIEAKEDLKKRLGRSPDCAEAVVIARYVVVAGDMMMLW